MHLHIRTNRLLILDIFVITCKESLLLQCAHTPWVNADGTRFVPLVSSMGAKCKHAGTNIVDMELIRLFFFFYYYYSNRSNHCLACVAVPLKLGQFDKKNPLVAFCAFAPLIAFFSFTTLFSRNSLWSFIFSLFPDSFHLLSI